MYDVVIIGAGPAGLSAAIYAIRKKLNILVLSQDVGGQAIEAHTVENYLGIPSIVGIELIEKFREHAKKLDIKIKEGSVIKKISFIGQNAKFGFKVEIDSETFETKSIIVASGKKYRKLEVPGAKKFEGKGISYCATCDAPLFSGKTVAVVGAGDAGQDAAWQLTKYAARVYLLNKYSKLRGDDRQMQDQLQTSEKVEIFNNCEPIEIKGNKFVSGLTFKCNNQDTPQQKEVEVQGIFVEIGSIAASEFLSDLANCNEQGEILINPKTNATSQPGIFAAGDVTDIHFKQIIIAAGEGAKAALSAYEYLKNR